MTDGTVVLQAALSILYAVLPVLHAVTTPSIGYQHVV